MGDIIKEIFKGFWDKLRIPEVLGLIAVILLVFRIIFSLEFKNLMLIFFGGLGRFGFLINIFQLATAMLFIASVIAFLASIFNTVIYLVIEGIINKRQKVSKRLLDKSDTMHRFFIGSKIAVVSVNMWLLVTSCYFYMFDEGAFNKYKECILNYTVNINFGIKCIIAIYILTIFISLLKLLNGIIYKFLYFRLDEETEKKLYELREKYSG
ncbi:hypothetical protein [Clostridium sp. HBUAS56017]|uniref:hypothetical protein n=1 Tax=Clostridium sp. HBUAS56017 TaxID=2571128 RepID=UPI001177675A|nr:hypothetical protein [Clostridium sp. HBUAS56017]